uniref:Uncharacterized protein n=1 Tax=Meloidogyne enterolobii TaxID=390850 RepID=A0A6V7XFJ5_MELEN|nr:unnamed protein product [Meloidogyne enterolobii]
MNRTLTLIVKISLLKIVEFRASTIVTLRKFCIKYLLPFLFQSTNKYIYLGKKWQKFG